MWFRSKVDVSVIKMGETPRIFLNGARNALVICGLARTHPLDYSITFLCNVLQPIFISTMLV